MITPEQKLDIATEAVKSAPPVVITAVSGLLGFTLHEWVLIATLAYIVFQIAWLVYKWRYASQKKDWHPH